MKSAYYDLMKLFLISFILFSFQSQNGTAASEIFIRCNQAGYLPDDIKSAVVFSESPVEADKFEIVNTATNQIEFSGRIERSFHTFNNFRYFYTVDFSAVKKKGNYRIIITGTGSPRFRIGYDVYNGIVDSLMLFFKEQRCGPTNPILHKVCHLWDIGGLEGAKNNKQIDVTGGWHDAGDYLKFVSTTAYTTYLMIFSYEFDKNKFGFDNDGDSVPDLLEEAKIGLDWLLRCNYEQDSLISRVQDLRDHSEKWRLPENDLLKFDRTGSTVISKSEAGIYSAVLALAARVWEKKFRSLKFSKSCLNSAINIYNIKDELPAVKENDSLMYRDENYYDEFELAAVELFNTTGDSSYLAQAAGYGDKAGSDYWWSYGDICSLAHYCLASHFPRFTEYIKNNVNSFNKRMQISAFNEGADYSWGSNTTFMGIALQAILLKSLDKSFQSDSLIILQRDFILGRNLWGVSFIHNIGSNFPFHQHSQVGFFNKGYLPGALSPGPAPASILEKYRLKFAGKSENIFNSDSLQYNDEFTDFITNEPTLTGNATAIFVFGYFSGH